jgi:hypothetical protein
MNTKDHEVSTSSQVLEQNLKSGRGRLHVLDSHFTIHQASYHLTPHGLPSDSADEHTL